MKLTTGIVVSLGMVPLQGVIAWGSLGHITSAFLASHFVSNTTQAHFQNVLRNSEPDYLASIATWADSIRYTKWGRFTKNFHFIDAHDSPPASCNVDYERDCKEGGCVISALANYTAQSLDPDLPWWQRAQAAKFVVHFIGDLHQPLHNEDVSRGGNGIYVLWQGREFNLHHVWDSSILEKYIGAPSRKPFPQAERWAKELAVEIEEGKFAGEKKDWLKGLDFHDVKGTAMSWSRECNALVCTHVFPEGPRAIEGQELSGEYYENAGPMLEKQVARAGYRMAAWLDYIAQEFPAGKATNGVWETADELSEEL